jgi:hypothetical protein
MTARRISIAAVAALLLSGGCSTAPIITTQVERSVLTEVFSTTE